MQNAWIQVIYIYLLEFIRKSQDIIVYGKECPKKDTLIEILYFRPVINQIRGVLCKLWFEIFCFDNIIFTRDDIFTVTHKLMCYLFYYPEQNTAMI
jgi:hypothetical protein